MNDNIARNNYLFIWDKCGFSKIDINDVVLLKASRSYCEIHLVDKKMEICLSMNHVLPYFDDNDLLRVNRSYAINLKYVDKLVGNTMIMSNGLQISIGKEYREDIFDKLVLVGSKSHKYIKNKHLGDSNN